MFLTFLHREREIGPSLSSFSCDYLMENPVMELQSGIGDASRNVPRDTILHPYRWVSMTTANLSPWAYSSGHIFVPLQICAKDHYRTIIRCIHILLSMAPMEHSSLLHPVDFVHCTHGLSSVAFVNLFSATLHG